MLALNELAMTFGPKLLFEGVTMNLRKGRRYGVVGANGCGKSTLLKLISGHEEPAYGDISKPKLDTIGFLRQDQFLHPHERILDVVMKGRTELWSALEEKDRLLENDEWNDSTINRMGELEEVIVKHDGYAAEAFAHTLLTGLGIIEEKHKLPLSALSGGYKLRVLLAQALFDNPDILILDEPTNHLDIMTISWLESYLKKDYKGLLILVSHDHSFLNTVVTDILDIDYGEIILYPGNYDHFLREKEAVAEQRLHEKAQVERRISELKSFVERFGAKASKARQAKSKQKAMDRLEVPDIKRSSRREPHFNFQKKRPSGKKVLSVNHVSKAYGENQVLRDVSFQVGRGDKLALIGHNGVGKSTLLKIITSNLKADEGDYEWGHETQVAYFAQDHHEQLDGSKRVLEWMLSQVEDKTETQLRAALGQMLFQSGDADKLISSLSGGEAARLYFAKVILDKPNVLILDEPTNHLDLESIEALKRALKSFEGTVIFVSHDRYFVAHLANRVIALTERGISDFRGSYKDYLAKFGEDYLSQVWLKVNN